MERDLVCYPRKNPPPPFSKGEHEAAQTPLIKSSLQKDRQKYQNLQVFA